MDNKRPTVYEECRQKGISRRDFLKFCTTMAAFMGLEASGVAQVVNALETKPRLPVIWLHLQECTCCTESFIRAAHPIVATLLLDKISLDYTETLMAAAGEQAEAAKEETMKKYKGEYLLMIEGSIPTKDEGYCCVGGKSALQITREAAEGAKAIIAWGNCACAGCVQAANPNPTGAKAIHKVIKGKPIINVQGCPPIADVMAGVIIYMLTFERMPQLDGLGRPQMFYSRRVHDTCYRRANFDAGLFVESFDDENAMGIASTKWDAKGRVPTTPAVSSNGTKGRATPSRAVTPASVAAKKTSGTTARSINGCPTYTDSASKRQPTRLALPWEPRQQPASPSMP